MERSIHKECCDRQNYDDKRECNERRSQSVCPQHDGRNQSARTEDPRQPHARREHFEDHQPKADQQANKRRREIEEQLRDSKYGIAWTDGTERVTQLNRSLENNLLKQIEYLTNMFYSQLGITIEIMNGTADEAAMTNYYNRIVEPIISAIVDEMKRKFLTKTARSQGQSILFFRDPFKLAPIGTVAEMADKFTRNEIMSSNEFRQVIGLKPSKDPRADELSNKNLNQSPEEAQNTAMAGGKETVDRLLAQERG